MLNISRLFRYFLICAFFLSAILFYKSLLIMMPPQPEEWDPYAPIVNYPSYRTKSDAPINVLFWTDNKKHWSGLGTGKLLQTPNFPGYSISRECPFVCNFTNDKSKLGEVDAVVFEGAPAGDSKRYEWLRYPLALPQKRPGQYWIQFSYETPNYYPLLNHPGYTSLFDVNMTYSHSKDGLNLPISLHCPYGDGQPISFLDKPRSKSKLVAFAKDKCAGAKGKNYLGYLTELMKHVAVDSFGGCMHNAETTIEADPKNYGEFLTNAMRVYSEYKFVLVFESEEFEDYVTETLATVYKAGAVPVYWGAPNIDDWTIGDHSLIKVSDYANPKDLADYLLNMDSKTYESYFAWKKQGISKQFTEKMDNCLFTTAQCRACAAVAGLKEREPSMSFGNTVFTDRSYALGFDGKTTHVEIGDQTEVRLRDDFTIAAWIYMESMNDWRVIDKNTAGALDGWSIDILKKGSRGYLRLCCTSGCWMGMKPLELGNWYFITVIFVSSFSRTTERAPGTYFYINGELDYEMQFPINRYGTPPIKGNTLPMYIGKAAVGDIYWHGMIDDVSIWGRPLPERRIRQLMFERLGGNEFGLIAYWSFNEGYDATAHDSSKNKLHGTIKGSVSWVPSETKELVLNKFI